MDIKEQYEDLTQKLQNNLPLKAYPTKELVQIFRDKRNPITLNTELTISSFHNSGDISGIMCAVEENKENVLVCGLTFLVFKSSSPLYKAIIDYQRKRNKRIKQLQQINRFLNL